MKDKLCIYICNSLVPEVAHLLQTGDYPDVELKSFPSSCKSKPFDEKEILDLVGKNTHEFDKIIVIMCTCFQPGMVKLEKFQNIEIIQLEHCFEILFNLPSIYHFIKQGSFLVSNGWLQNYKKKDHAWGFNSQTTKKYLGEPVKKVLLLETGLPVDYLPNLEALSHHMGLPYEVFPIGNCHLQKSLDALILSWRNKKENLLLNDSIARFSRETSEHLLIFNHLKELVNETEQESIIMKIGHLCSLLFAPGYLVYERFSQGTSIDRVQFVGTDEPVEPSQSLKVELKYNGELLGCFEIGKVMYPEYFPQYLAMASAIEQMGGLVLSNANRFNDLGNISRQFKELNKQLQFILNATGTGTWEWNVQTGHTQFNEQWANMLGYTLDELEPTTIETWIGLTHPEDIVLAQAALEKCFNKESQLYEAKFRMKHRDGQWVWVLDRGQVAKWDPNGKPLIMLGTHQDINQIMQTEVELLRKESRLESLLKITQHPAHTVQELLDFSLEEAIALTGSKIGYIYFYNEERKEFILNSWSKEVMDQCHVVDPQTVYELEKTGIWGEAVRQAQPIMVNNFAASNPLKKGVPEGHAPLHKFLTIPVFDEGKIVAVVGVANKADDYDQLDIRQLTLMMDSVWKNVQRKETEQKLEKANRLYAVISQVNQAIVHNRDRQRLFNEICRIAIDYGKFRMAWIGLLHNETQKVVPVAFAGEEQGYLSVMFQVTLDKKLGGSGPVGLSIHTNKYFVCNDIANDPEMRFWKDEALKRDYQSVIGLPLCLFGKPVAALAIYSSQANFFNPEEIKLLEEVAYDISFALDALETEAEQKKAEEMARERLKELNAFYKLSELTENKELTSDELCAEFVNILPQSWKYNQVAYAKIVIGGNEYRSEKYRQKKQWFLSAPIKIDNIPLGEIEVGYNEQMPLEDEGSFLKEERLLINGIAERLGHIIERKQTEIQLQRSEAKFRNLMNQMQLGLAVHEIILDQSGQPVDYRFLDCNPAFEELTGLKRSDILGKTVLKILPNTEKIWIEKYGEVALTGRSVKFENYARELDKYYSVRAYQPAPMQFAVIVEDITHIKHAQQNLESSNQKFKLLSRAATEMVLLETSMQVYQYLARSLNSFYPKTVVLIQIANSQGTQTKLSHIEGVSQAIINKVLRLTGINPFEINFAITEEFFKIFKSGKLYNFQKGLAEFVGQQFPRKAALAIEKLLGIRQIYTIGINKDDKLLAVVHIFNRNKEAIIDNNFIETFVGQAGIVIEQKRTSELLSISEEKYRLITENASDVIWVLDINTMKFTYISPAIEQLRGYTVEEALAQSMEGSVTPDSILVIQKALHDHLHKYLTHTLEIDYFIDEIQQPCKDGRIIWVEVSTRFRQNIEGNIEVVGVSRNIDERKKMEAAIKENEQKFRLLFENSPLGIYVANTQGDILDGNSALLTILGSPSLEMTQKINVLNYPPLVENGYAHHFKECVEKKKTITIELPYLTHWGKKIFLSSYLVPLTNEQGKVEKVYTLMEDITLRKKNEEELIKLSRVAEQNSASILISDLTGTIEYVNPKFIEVTGYSYNEAIGNNTNMLKSGFTAKEEYRELWETITQGKDWTGVFRNRKKNGELYWEKVHISPVKNPMGETINYIAIKEDITQLLKDQEALIESEARLKEALVSKDKFFSIISHDLRSPFATLVSFTELMSDENSHFSVDEYKQYARALNKTAQSTFSLLENLLEWSRLQRGSISFKPETIYINELIKNCDHTTLEKIKNKQINFEIKADDHLVVLADKNMLKAILRNLMSNAIKFTPTGGSINLEVSLTPEKQILFAVRDNGIGMPQHIMDNLFNLSEKISRAGTNNEPSSGLGLILCKEFVEKHGGKIWAESDPEGTSGRNGSTFYFSLPS